MCPKGCCRAAMTPYTRKWVPTETSEEERKARKKKAGVFVLDPTTQKLLLVQSCGRFWGPPKGSMEVGEDVPTAAVRELQEETGVVVGREELYQRVYLKASSHYYYFHLMAETAPAVQHLATPGGNDANAVGWFSLACLKTRLEEGKMIGNSALKQFMAPGLVDRLLAARASGGRGGVGRPEVEEEQGEHKEGEEEGHAAEGAGVSGVEGALHLKPLDGGVLVEGDVAGV